MKLETIQELKYDQIKDHETIKRLNISADEFDKHYWLIKHALEQEIIQSQNEQNQTYMLLERDENNQLQLLSCSDIKDWLFAKHYLLSCQENKDETLRFQNQEFFQKKQIEEHIYQSRKPLIKTLVQMIKTQELLSFYLRGEMGCGKTRFIQAYVNEMIIRHECNIAFVEMDKLINIYIDSMHYQQNIFEQEQDPLAHMKNADILVFDNLGNERFYNFVHYTKLLNILKHRYQQNKQTIFISQYELDFLVKRYTNTSNNDRFDKNNVIDFVELIKSITENNQFAIEGKNLRFKE